MQAHCVLTSHASPGCIMAFGDELLRSNGTALHQNSGVLCPGDALGGDTNDVAGSADRSSCVDSGGQWLASELGAHCRCSFTQQFAPEAGGCVENSALEAACTESGGSVESGSCACPDGTGLNALGVCAADSGEGKALYEQNCVSCHGVSGHGDGDVGKYFDPPPRNFVEANFQFNATHPTTHATPSCPSAAARCVPAANAPNGAHLQPEGSE